MRSTKTVGATSIILSPALAVRAVAGQQTSSPDERRPLTEVEQSANGMTPDPAFSALDSNGDGHLSPQEAGQSSKLAKQWHRGDSNQDDQIDQIEFSAFEAARTGPSGQQNGPAECPTTTRQHNQPGQSGRGMLR